MSDPVKIPVTSADEGQTFMSPGLHRLKVVSITEYVDKDGKPKKDDRGWPGLTVTLKNKNGETIAFSNYYCTAAADDPIRKDDARRCKSDYYLTKFKNALGFGQEEVATSSIIGKYLYMPVVEVHYTNADGTPFIGNNGKEMIFTELEKEFYPDVKPADGQKAYDFEGDPITAGKPLGGRFVTKKIRKGSTVSSNAGSAKPIVGAANPPAEPSDLPEEADF